MKSFSILLARPEPVAAAGSSSGERGLPACGFRLLAETDFLLPLALDEFTIPVRSKTRRGELGLWRLAKTDFLRLGSARAWRVTPVRLGLSAPSPNALCPIERGLCACRASELFFEYSFAIALSRESSLPRKQPPNVDYANFSGKFALAANRGQLTG
jgi:hypothetical protein